MSSTYSSPLESEPSSTEFVASFAQQRLWFLQQLNPESAAYNIPAQARLCGPLDSQLLRKTLNAIVQRHEPLRTRFRVENDVLKQVIVPVSSLELTEIDLTCLAPEERNNRVHQLIEADSKKPFDLQREAVIRAQLLRLTNEEHIFALNIHHIAADGWSIAVLFRELAVLYDDFSKGRAASLPELTIQYADFSVWQRQWLQGEVLERQLSYWKNQLAGAPALIEFPSDRARPATPSFRGGRQFFTYSAEIAESLKSLSQKENCSLFMTLLAVFQVLLMRCSGQTDVVAGSPIGIRTMPEVENLIGCFLNTLALRTDLSGEPTFRDLLARVRDVALDAYDHQELPWDRLVEELKVPRQAGWNPIFQNLFQFLALPGSINEFGGITLQRLPPIENNTAKFDIIFTLEETTEGLLADIEYSTDLFDGATIDRLLSQYGVLLQAVVENPDQKISELPLLTERERHELVVEWNDNATPLPAGVTLHQLFEKQTGETPDATALVFGEQRLSYRVLNERANQLARHLVTLGVGTETQVGICTKRSIEMVVGLLAVLKAGGAYVPLDPNYPTERLAFILEDANVAVLLTERPLLETVPTRAGTQVVCLDEQTERAENSENLRSAVDSVNLAYVIYTSGSTGKPKGVAIEHQSAIALVEWARTVFTRDELSGVLFSTSICFDLSIFELFVTLSLGGKVILAENVLSLPTLPAANEVVLLNTVPSAMTELLRSGKIPASIRVVNLAGEPLSQKLVEEIYRTGSVEKIYDLYGPTEDTTYSTFSLRTRAGRETIGRPLCNTQAYILDAKLQPVPIGVAGELHLGGAGLARGYWQRPELTAEKFISNPFAAGERLYKTGDLARYLPDGNIEYLGRLDHQVKIRGFRIELGEIQTLLAEHPGVQEAVVLAREDVPGEKHLVAYVVSHRPPSANELRAFLRAKLPDYMVPSAVVFLEKFPLTPNGKRDRKALPVPHFSPDIAQIVFPQTRLQEKLATIWQEVLRLPKIGIHDNFFESGGHSLLATQVVSRIRSACGKELELREFFKEPTIAALASLLEKSGVERPGATAIKRVPRSKHLVAA